VHAQPGAVFRAGQAQELFKQTGPFDVSPEGKWVLLVKPPQVAAAADWRCGGLVRRTPQPRAGEE